MIEAFALKKHLSEGLYTADIRSNSVLQLKLRLVKNGISGSIIVHPTAMPWHKCGHPASEPYQGQGAGLSGGLTSYCRHRGTGAHVQGV